MMGLFRWLFGRKVRPDGGPESAARDEVESLRSRGVSHLTRGEYAEAAAAFREALHSRPDDPDLRKALAMCCRALGDEEGATAEAKRDQELGRRGAEWWTRFRGVSLPLLWDGECVGHFTPGQVDVYPKVKGGWTSSGSRQAQQFEAILLRADSCTLPEPLRLGLGAGVGGEYLVSGVSVVLDQGGHEQGVLLDLKVVRPPDGWEA
jgi:hypothetical protein